MDLAVRLDVSESEALNAIDKINKYLKPGEYLFVFEISKKVKKPHIHGYLTVNGSKKLESIRKWFSRLSYCKTPSSYSCVEIKSTNLYLDYICKDMNIISTNMDEAQIEALLEKAADIKVNKSQSMVSKLLHFITGFYLSDYDLDVKTTLHNTHVLEKCIEYFRTNKLLFPNKSQMFQYVQTILSITGNEISVFADYYSIFVSQNKSVKL